MFKLTHKPSDNNDLTDAINSHIICVHICVYLYVYK